MFWLRQHVLPLIEGFSEERERSPGAESFRSALSDGAESFYSALSDHRSSVYYDAESSDLDSSDSDSRYADVDEELFSEQMPEVGTDYKEAVAKERTVDDAYESFSYGKLFEDVYGSVVHRPPLLRRQQTHQGSQNEMQPPPRKWRPPPRIPVKVDLFQECAVPAVNHEPPAHCRSQPVEFTGHVEHEDDWQEMESAELEGEMQEGEVSAPLLSYLEQAAEEFAEFILDEAREEACRFVNAVSVIGDRGKIARPSLKSLPSDNGGQTELLECAVTVANGTAQHTATSQDQDILDAFNRQFEPCFDSEEELDPQAFENASEDDIDNTGQSDIEEKGLLNRNALLGTFKRFPKSLLKSLPHVHSFSDGSRNGGSPRRCPSPLFPVTSSASDLTEKYWRRHSSDIADTGVQPKGLNSTNKNFLSSDPDISTYPCTSLSNGHGDGAMVDVLNMTMGASFPLEPQKKINSVKAIDIAQCLPVTHPEKLLEESQSEFSSALPSAVLLHENKGNGFAPMQEKCGALLSEPPKPPPRSPRHSNVMQPFQCQQISQEYTSKVDCFSEIGMAQVENQAIPEGGPCLESHLKVPARRKKTMPGFQSFRGISVEDSPSSEKVSASAADPLLLKDRSTVEDSTKEEQLVQDKVPLFEQGFLHRVTCDESEEDSSFSSSEDPQTDVEMPSNGNLGLLSYEDPEPDGEPPTSGILRLPFSLSQLTGHLFEDDSLLDVVSFHVVDNCDFLKDTCDDSPPYVVKLGPSDDFSAFLVDPDTSEHSELDGSGTDSVFEDAASQSFNESNLDSFQSGCVTPDENNEKGDEDFENQQSGKQRDQSKSFPNIPARPRRKCAQTSLIEKQHSTISTGQCVDLKMHDKISAELGSPETNASRNMSCIVTSIPDEPQSTHMPYVQCQGGNLVCNNIRAETLQEHSMLEADVHRKEDVLEMSGSKEAAGALSGITPRPTSSSYQEVPGAGLECDKPILEKTSGGSLVGAALVGADSSEGSRSQNSVMTNSGEMNSTSGKADYDVLQEAKRVIETACDRDLVQATLKHFKDFAKDEQGPGGSPRPPPTSKAKAEATPCSTSSTEEDGSNSSPETNDLAPVMGQTLSQVSEMCRTNAGIQGHHNSCYLDATLFAMFSCTYVFDDILTRKRDPSEDIKEYDQIQKVLRDDIVCTLRRKKYVPHENVMKLRELLDSLGNVSGLTTEEKDPEEFLNSLIHALRVPPFLKLSSQQETHLYQLFVTKHELLERPTVQQLFHQSIHESRIKLKEIPKALIIQMPRCGKQFKLYDLIVPSLELDITDALENSPRFCYVCGKQATHECWDCFRPDVGLEVISYCRSCSDTVHKHHSRETHKTATFENDFGEGATPRKISMRLFAIVCIETSHYVCFVKCPVKDSTKPEWCFFDSMADREGGEDGHNIPKVEKYADAEVWLGPKGLEKLRGISENSIQMLPGKTRRVFRDAYMCMYENPLVMKYK
ncbi:ubiquitin carboxyl-terminal hydrolase CYLD isoform X2 [Amblyomma americanum]